MKNLTSLRTLKCGFNNLAGRGCSNFLPTSATPNTKAPTTCLGQLKPYPLPLPPLSLPLRHHADDDINNSLYSLPDLTTLDLCNNQLTRLSEATSDTLLVLGLANNQLKELSSTIVMNR